MAPERLAVTRATVVLALFLAGCGYPIPVPIASGPGAARPTPATGSVAALEADVHARVDQHRAGRGLPRLTYDERIAEVARRHSTRMANGSERFGHAGFDSRSAEIQELVQLRSMAENVAFDSRADPAPHVVRSWLGSAGHRRNIEGDFQVTGVGIARSPDGTYYVTQLFVSLR